MTTGKKVGRVMRTEVFPGRALADRILTRVAVRARRLRPAPTLAIVLVGHNSASETYVAEKERRGASAGITVHTLRFPARVGSAALLRAIRELNRDRTVSGTIVQLPLPKRIPADRVIAAVRPEKDVDGFHPQNVRRLARGPRFVPPTIAGILLALTYARTRLAGQSVAFIGKPGLFPASLASLLNRAGARLTVVRPGTVRDSRILRNAPIVLSLAGRPGLVRGPMLRPGAVVVDAGFTRRGKQIAGDVDAKSVSGVARFLTPVPGGIGPLTVAFLLENVVMAAERKTGR
jgi:methylenetetrahydrofolate dehydrogenase (NADP+)/methenyltetrahydrofolate cyclohydrolase